MQGTEADSSIIIRVIKIADQLSATLGEERKTQLILNAPPRFRKYLMFKA